MAKILSGKEVASSLEAKLKEDIAALKTRGVTPGLAIIRATDSRPMLSYENNAALRASRLGIDVFKYSFPENACKDELIKAVEEINADRNIHGCIMLRPLPGELRTHEKEISNRLTPEKDIDCMTDISFGGVFTGKSTGFPPCTPQAVIELLDHYAIAIEGKRAAVIGRSLIVGRPAALMLLNRNATVTLCHKKTKDLSSITKESDIIVSAAGCPGLLTKENVSPGQVVIDVSTTWDEKKPNGSGGFGTFTGDAVFEEVESVVDAITPVPGGIGMITIYVLFKHLIEAADNLTK
jgi:methylenetetrahydrofolate dehydrogenase (NADP+)/methenyltetrahydrofolate cyclohydrolase